MCRSFASAELRIYRLPALTFTDGLGFEMTRTNSAIGISAVAFLACALGASRAARPRPLAATLPAQRAQAGTLRPVLQARPAQRGVRPLAARLVAPVAEQGARPVAPVAEPGARPAVLVAERGARPAVLVAQPGVRPVGTGGGAGSAGANDCTPLPGNLLLTDFSPATLMGVSDGASWTTSKQELWGSGTSLTGGDAFYQGKPGSAPTVTLHGEALTVTATIEGRGLQWATCSTSDPSARTRARLRV